MVHGGVSYRRAFLKSRHHLWLLLLTVGLGFASGQALGLLAGATLYALGWVYLPDAGFFKRQVDAHFIAEQDRVESAKWAEFQAQHDALLSSLSPVRRTRYNQLAGLCAAIEKASNEAQSATGMDLESRLEKLDELLWTFLRMLTVEQTLEVFLEGERKERIPEVVRSLEAESETLTVEVSELKKRSPVPLALAPKERLLTSRLERLTGLRQRLAKLEQAQANLELIRSEQERLVEQVKLIRADAVASKNADALSARIDLSIEHLSTTNQWLSELTEFKDVTQQMPEMPAHARARRLSASTPPQLPNSQTS